MKIQGLSEEVYFCFSLSMSISIFHCQCHITLHDFIASIRYNNALLYVSHGGFGPTVEGMVINFSLPYFHMIIMKKSTSSSYSPVNLDLFSLCCSNHLLLELFISSAVFEENVEVLS